MKPRYPHADIGQLAQRSAPVIVELIDGWLHPASVLDVGCGVGAWLAEWQRRGRDVFGVDRDVPPESLLVPAAHYRSVDLESEFRLGRRFDLVMSLEVAEHIEPGGAEQFVSSLVEHGSVILFSAAIPRQPGDHHLNCQWPSWWAQRFADHGFVPYDTIRPRIWDNPDVVWWYRQNTLLFAEPNHPALGGLPTVPMPVDVVHPQWWLDYTAPASIRAAFRQLRGSIGRRLVRR